MVFLTQRRIAMLFENFSNFEVETAIEKVFKSERNCQIHFILLLKEVYDRKLYLSAGHSSMLNYCVHKFCLSEYSAHKRIQLSKISKKFPEILEALREKKLSLTTASLIAPKLKDETYLEQIDQCAYKSKDEVKRILVIWEPKPEVKDLIRHCKIPVVDDTAHQPVCGQPQNFSPSQIFDFAQAKDVGTKRTTSELLPLSEVTATLKCQVSLKTEEKIKRAKELLGIDGMGELIDMAFEALLEKKDPKRREDRRNKKKILSEAKKSASGNAGPMLSEAKHPAKPVSVVLKDKLLHKAGYQCTFVSSEGHRCTERRGLEVEHIKPKAKGGTNEPENLTILCRAHNQYQGAMHFGWEKMRARSG
jgi:hypothetical protein